MKTKRLILIGLCFVVAVVLWHTCTEHVAVVLRPRGVMGTTCRLVAVVPRYRQSAAETALRDAEAVLRDLESRLSSWIDESEISKLNRAEAGREVPLSSESRKVLQEAWQAFQATDGTFDITCRPLIELWREAGKQDRLPSDNELASARSASSWESIELTDKGAVKQLGSSRVDLGGIGKGYAIDAAVRVLHEAGIQNGFVDLGGDERLFGTGIAGQPWSVAVKDPARDGVLMQWVTGETAVCTSGDYARYVEIEGRRYSHIVDPRSGLPAEAATSVTVLAPTAQLADIWATALSVLGPSGLKSLPPQVEALVIVNSADSVRMVASPGLSARVEGPLPDNVEIFDTGETPSEASREE